MIFLKSKTKAEKVSIQETRTLIKLKGFYDQGNWFFKWERGCISLKGTSPEVVARLFQKAQVKDAATQPRSARNKTYMEMVQGIMTGADRLCWIWSNNVQTLKDAAKTIGGIVA